jgi:hypothetical protein
MERTALSARHDILVTDKNALLERSALCRLRMHREAREARAALHWTRIVAAAAVPLGRLGLGLAMAAATRLVARAAIGPKK